MHMSNTLFGRKLPVLAMTLIAGFVLAGCSAEGKWSLTRVEPTAARTEFQYQALTLQEDGTFYAESSEMLDRNPSGTWSMQNGTLTLREKDGETHAYSAKFKDPNTLVLESTWKDGPLVARFEKVGK